MKDLFTTQVLVKQLLGGDRPPLTPLTNAALEIVDPSFCPGMGILNEDIQKGIQCPIRGCGEFYHKLSAHLVRHDKNLGVPRGQTEEVLRRALGLIGSKFVSSSYAKRQSAAIKSRKISPPTRSGSPNEKAGAVYDAAKDAVEIMRRARHKPRYIAAAVRRNSWGRRNARMSCDSQLKKRIQLVIDKVRRMPSEREVKICDPDLMPAINELGWDIESALAWFRLEAGISDDVEADVWEVLSAWRDTNSRMPTEADLDLRHIGPPLPSKDVIMKYYASIRRKGRKPPTIDARGVSSVMAAD